MDITRYGNQNNLRIGSLKFKLEFAGNLKSYNLPLTAMLYVILLHYYTCYRILYTFIVGL